MENNNLNELEQLKADYETLKGQLDQQEIVNERLMKSAMQTDTDFFMKNRKTTMITYPIMALLGFAYMACLGFWSLAICYLLLLSVMVVVELWLTRNTRRQVMENADLRTLSQNMQKLKTGYAIYTTLLLIVGFLFLTAFVFKKIDSVNLPGAQYMSEMRSLIFAGVLMLFFAILAYRNFVGHCNNVIRQIDAIEGKPATKKNWTFWCFLGGLTLLMAGSIFLVYQVMKPMVYTRPENDTTAEGRLELQVMDEAVGYDPIIASLMPGKPVVQTVTCGARFFKKEGEPTPIIVSLTPQASALWHAFTSDMKGHRVALLMDGTQIQEWNIQSAIDNGQLFIYANPNWSKAELEAFCKQLVRQ